MSVKVWSLCWRVPVCGNTKLVLLRLADFANDTGGSIYPAIGTIAEDCGISDRTVRYCLKELETHGIIVRNRAVGRGHTNSYRIDVKQLNEMARPAKEYEQTGDTDPIKHADFAGITDDATVGKGADFDGKGADFDRKGASLAANPSLTVKNPPAAYSSPANNRPKAAGGDLVKDVIDEFFRLVESMWGAPSKAQANRYTQTNIEIAGEWLTQADGRIPAVFEALILALTALNNSRKGKERIPFALGAIGLSMPERIQEVMKPGTGWTSTSYTIAGTKPDADVEQPYMPIRIIARRNGWDDVADRIKALSDENVEAANAYALSMEAQVQTKKERAAA